MGALSDLTTERILGNFEILGDWEQRFGYLIDLGRKLPDLPEEYRTEEYQVRGCQATVWLHESLTESVPPTIELLADSDAILVKGLIAILLIMFSGKTPQEVLTVDAEGTFRKLGLDQHLSPTRRNGLYAMTERIRALAARMLPAASE